MYDLINMETQTINFIDVSIHLIQNSSLHFWVLLISLLLPLWWYNKTNNDNFSCNRDTLRFSGIRGGRSGKVAYHRDKADGNRRSFHTNKHISSKCKLI